AVARRDDERGRNARLDRGGQPQVHLARRPLSCRGRGRGPRQDLPAILRRLLFRRISRGPLRPNRQGLCDEGGGVSAERIRYRPHHFLCSLGFEGKGYSPAFTANMDAIVMGRLRAEGGDATTIEVTGATDDICAPCPKRRGRLCTNEAKIRVLDRAHAAALRLKPRERLTWGEARARIRDNVPPGSLK